MKTHSIEEFQTRMGGARAGSSARRRLLAASAPVDASSPREWRVAQTLRFDRDRVYGEGYAHLGFHGPGGVAYVLGHWANWVGALDGTGALAWSAGALPLGGSPLHIETELPAPMFVSGTSEGLVYVSTYLDRSVRLIEPLSRRATILVDGAALGMTDIGNCLVDGAGELWVNEVEGRAIWHFSPSGERLERIGAPAGSGGEAHSARPGASPLPESMRFEEARFGWIADIRLGPSGNIYVLDAGSLALWSLDPNLRRITRVAGSGEAGDAGEGGPALLVSLGEDKSRRFGGPISLSIDEEGNAFIGDAANGRVLVVEAATGRAHAIARGLKGLCSMDYFEGRLFLPEDGGRLLVLERGDA